MSVPRLATALTGPVLHLERELLNATPAIEHWLRNQWQEHEAPFYCSVDLRNSGFKIAPVDTNLFPGGFNNLNPDFEPLCVQAAMTALEKICPDARGAVLVPENHTRNQFYLQNVATLARILRQAGMHVRVGSLLPEISKALARDALVVSIVAGLPCAALEAGLPEARPGGPDGGAEAGPGRPGHPAGGEPGARAGRSEGRRPHGSAELQGQGQPVLDEEGVQRRPRLQPVLVPAHQVVVPIRRGRRHVPPGAEPAARPGRCEVGCDATQPPQAARRDCAPGRSR